MKVGYVKYRYPFIKPKFPSVDEIITDYTAIVESNWFTNFGPYEKRLSSSVAEYIGNNVFATTVSSCTAGLEIAIRDLFVGNELKKKVIMPSFTFVADAEVLIHSGLIPVFIDIDKDNWQPNIIQARELLSSNSNEFAGILLCNIFGVGNSDIKEWEDLSKNYNIPLVIDSAAGFGSKYDKNEKVGARGDCEIFSLHATKPFSVGEGGLITSKNMQFINRMRSMQNFGFESDRNVHRIGTNAKMQELTAAIGLRQLTVLDEKIQNRQKVYEFYKEALLPRGYMFQRNAENSTIAFVSTIIEKHNIEKIINDLKIGGVEARRYYVPALHKQNKLIDYCEVKTDLSTTDWICDRIVSLPLYENMTEEDTEYICGLLPQRA